MVALRVPIQQSSTAQTLRDYQQACVQAIQEAWSENQTPLAWLATGGGKTTILSQLLVETVNPYQHRALVFAHTQEIIFQIRDRIANQYGEVLRPWYGPYFAPGIGVVMGEQDSPDARIVVATRQSLHRRRLERAMQTGAFDTVLIDEGHHVSDNTYLDIVKACREANPAVRVAGLTATPKRTDKQALGMLFTGICFKWTILDGIQGGYLSPATRLKIKTGVDTSRVKSSHGDYNEKQLVSVLDASNWVHLAVEAYQEHAGDRQTLAFFPKVDMSREFIRQLQEAGVPAAHIDADTDRGERGDILRRYQQGELRVVSNMGVLTEGFDAPQTSCILMARPTRSETLFTQIIGRGLRLFPGKKDCLIIDLTVIDTKLLEVGTILGQMVNCENCQAEFFKGLKACPECGADAGTAQPLTKPCPACGEEISRSAKACPLCGYVIPKMPILDDFKGTGEGLSAEVASLFHSLSSAWFAGKDSFFSVGVGFDGSALVIAPPSFAGNEARINERLMRGYHMLPALNESRTDPELKETLLAQLEMLERERARITEYSLYYVPTEQLFVGTRRPLPEEQQAPVMVLRTNADLASLMREADQEARVYGGIAADSSASWRGKLCSEGQMKYLKVLGFKAKEIPQDLTAGQASQMINHVKAVKRVRKFIQEDCLPERK